MKKIDKDIIKETSIKAQKSKRKRMNHNFHPKLSDPLQRMLNAVEPGTYIQPHKHEHPNKTEVFIIIKGRIAVIEFDNNGKIIEYIILDASKGNYGAEIKPHTWHTIISLEKGSVAYEVKNGPYIQIEDKHFAKWAPAEEDYEAGEYLKHLQKAIT